MHDINGTLLEIGNKVYLEAKVEFVNEDNGYCNLTLGIGKDRPHGDDNMQTTVVVNSKQVLLYRKDA